MKFQQLLKDIILEDKRLETLLSQHAYKDKVKVNKETGKKKVKKAPLTPEQLLIIVANDPTSRIEGIEQTEMYDVDRLKQLTPEMVKKTGEYSNWIVKQFKTLPQKIETPYTEREAFVAEYDEKKRLFFEDLYEVKEDLIKFHRFKTSDKIEDADINSYDFDSLRSVVSKLSLEMATSTEAERKSSLLHPAATKMYEDDKWFVAKLDEDSDFGKEAAIFYGGSNKRPEMGETSWCTSAPGMNYYFTYLKKGPYYVLINKQSEEKGQVSGLPAERYQFHFESNQFMNASDRQIDFVKFFNDNPSLKEAFKGVISSHFGGAVGGDSNKVEVNYPSSGISKLIGLYGFEDFFESLPDTLESFDFTYSSGGGYRNENLSAPELDIPASIGRFKNLEHLVLNSCVKSLPKEIGNLKNLQILILSGNKQLDLPEDGISELITNGKLNLLILTDTKYDSIDSLPPKIKASVEARDEEQTNGSEEPFMIIYA